MGYLMFVLATTITGCMTGTMVTYLFTGNMLFSLVVGVASTMTTFILVSALAETITRRA